MLTLTMQRRIAKGLRAKAEPIGDPRDDKVGVPLSALRAIAASNSVPLDEIKELASNLGYLLTRDEDGPPREMTLAETLGVDTAVLDRPKRAEKSAPGPAKRDRPSAPRTSATVRRAIERCLIFRRLMPPEAGENPSEVMVVTTLAELQREREAILKWIEDAKDGL